MFLYNPTSREINVSLPLSGDGSAALGFTCVDDNDDDHGSSSGASGAAAPPPVLIRQLASSERTDSVSFPISVLRCTDILNLTLPATSARVFSFEQWNGTKAPLVLGSVASTAELDATGATLTIVGAQGESGTAAALVAVLPTPENGKVDTVIINGEETTSGFTVLPADGSVYGQPAVVLRGAAWGGQRFQRAQEVLPTSITTTTASSGGSGGGSSSSSSSSGSSSSSSSSSGSSSSSDSGREGATTTTTTTTSWAGHFSVPQAVIDQLRGRNASYPVLYNTDPLDSDDANVPWLAPGRLLLFVKYSTPIDDTLNVTGDIDGHPLLVRENAPSGAIFYSATETIIWPRQARDKHKKS